jgi:hypothetical protein
MAEGKITRIVEDRQFFFIEKDYWCHFNQYNKKPTIGDIVYYEPEENNGKKNAKNVKFIKNSFGATSNNISTNNNDLFENYLKSLEVGYFEDDSLKKVMIIDFPQKLAEMFQKKSDINKPTQIRKYYDQCKLRIEGPFKVRKDFNSAKSELLKMIPLINNAKMKNHISNEFYLFMEKNIYEAIKSPKNLIEGFMPHFQSLIGYYKQK